MPRQRLRFVTPSKGVEQMSIRRLVPCLVALAAALSAGEAVAAPTFASCRPQLEHDVECTKVAVPLDHDGAVPGTLGLHVERVRAKAAPARGALFVLSGGPGESVTSATDTYAAALAPARATHDLILVDQRGTGLSGALDCPLAFPRSGALDDTMAGCGAALGPLVSLYGIADVADDLERVRQALGLERISLFGVSYGTRIALAYASRYPQRVERLVLDSVVPLTGSPGYTLNSIAAVPRVLGDVCAGGCPFTSDATADLAQLVRRMAAGPLRGRVARGDGKLHHVRMGRADLLALLLAGDYLPALRGHVPAAVRSALAGDPAPLLRLRELVTSLQAVEPTAREFSSILYVATTCAETTEPWLAATTPSERTAAARAYLDGLPDDRFAPFDRATALGRSTVSYCRSWPGSGSAAPLVGALPDVPVLVLSGAADLRTPLEDARQVASLFPRSQLLSLGGVGHGVAFQDSACVARALGRFLAGRTADRCAKVAALPPERPLPAPGRAVGTIDAVELTLRDVLAQLPLTILTKSTWLQGDFLFFVRAGGLRGGRYSATLTGITLERVTVVPGVTVSGRLKGVLDPLRGRMRVSGGELQVHAPAGRRGRLVLTGGRLTGALAGKPVTRSLRLDGRN
jgi:pimeloyl-ACP methyl ester carboxylesterase